MLHWNRSWGWLLDFGWLVFLLIVLKHFWQNRRDLVKAQSWLKTKGHIRHCEWTKVGHSAWPKIEYDYQVHDTTLTGEYLFLDTSNNNPNSKYSRNIAYKVALAFKENSEIDVYYNPNQPEQSALDITIPKKLNAILFIIIAFIVLQLLVIFFRYGVW